MNCPQVPRRALARLAAATAVALTALLSACGGGEGDVPAAPDASAQGGGSDVARSARIERPASRAEAARFLTQATFGPTDADIDRVMQLGYSAWIDEQFTRSPQQTHRAYWDQANATIRSADAKRNAGQAELLQSFWKEALTGKDQLRQRMAYALSQIFVISMVDDKVGGDPRAVAAWLDMLEDKGFGNYRDLLQAVALSPVMGTYLSHLRNQKADPKTGRVPDENFAREVMQLFSIGLVELNADGTVRGGTAVETYGAADVAGMAKVFTGWSWDCPEWPNNDCFKWGSVGGVQDPDRSLKSMRGYPQYHATEAKAFLGVSIPAQSRPDPDASLQVALDTLFNHPNVGPFIGRQLIQRFVSSNPSAPYVKAVADAFNGSAGGGRGDMKAVLKAILMNPEARRIDERSGKVREPVLKLSAFLRAFDFRSDSGQYRVNNTDSPGDSLGQTPLRAPSVFNFYRPGYVPPGLEPAAGLVAPELQIAHETSAAGYVNFMRDNVAWGAGDWLQANGRRDLQAGFAAELALCEQPGALLDELNAKLFYGQMPAELKAEIQTAVEAVVVPALNTKGSNQKQIDSARRNRVNAAVFLAVVSPEFQVQK